MVRNLVVLTDGTEIFSGGEGSAVMSLELTENVNPEKELSPGGVCARMVQLTLLDRGDVHLSAGDALQLYRVEEDGTRIPMGEFLAEKPERTGMLLKLTAYDRMILLDRDLSLWLAGLTCWPYSLQQLGEMVCGACGLSLREEEIPNGSFLVDQFFADSVTGRQLLGWIAEAAGCFCRLQQGQVAFSWYEAAPVSLGPTVQQVAVSWEAEALHLTLPEGGVFAQGDLALEHPRLTARHDGGTGVIMEVDAGILRQFYYQNTLSLEDYETAPIEKIQLRQSSDDVGTVYPDMPEGNTLAITGNPILAARDAQSLLPAAETLFSRLAGSCYTPCTLTLPDTPGLEAGQRLEVFDETGKQHWVYIMELSRTDRGMTLTCNGSPRRDSSFAVNRQERQLQGKVLRLQTDVDGLMAENSDQKGKISRLELDIEGIRGQVSAQQTSQGGLLEQISRLEQNAGQLQLTLEQLRQDGSEKIRTVTGYTFDDRGLQIAREGEQMKSLLDNTGLCVTRSGQMLLQADYQGVEATDVTVRNYLVVGEFARFEDYGAGRTACFYLEE